MIVKFIRLILPDDSKIQEFGKMELTTIPANSQL